MGDSRSFLALTAPDARESARLMAGNLPCSCFVLDCGYERSFQSMFTPYPPPSPTMHRWRGISGEWYWFSIFRIDAVWDLEGIVYILARARGDGYFGALYVGQSAQGGERLTQHEKMPDARRLGATHVHVHFVETRAARFAIETDLRRQLRPVLNEQPIPVSNLAGLAGLGAPAPAVPSRNYLAGIAAEHTAGFGGSDIFGLDMRSDFERALASLARPPKNCLNELNRPVASAAIGSQL